MKIFVAGAYFDTEKSSVEVYQDIAKTIKTYNKNITVIQPNDINDYRQNFKKNNPLASKIQVDAAMVDYDLQLIKDVDLVIADVSNKSLGLGIELGVALCSGTEVRLIAKQDSKISNMVYGAFSSQEVHYYSDPDELKNIVCSLAKP